MKMSYEEQVGAAKGLNFTYYMKDFKIFNIRSARSKRIFVKE